MNTSIVQRFADNLREYGRDNRSICSISFGKQKTNGRAEYDITLTLRDKDMLFALSKLTHVIPAVNSDLAAYLEDITPQLSQCYSILYRRFDTWSTMNLSKAKTFTSMTTTMYASEKLTTCEIIGINNQCIDVDIRDVTMPAPANIIVYDCVCGQFCDCEYLNLPDFVGKFTYSSSVRDSGVTIPNLDIWRLFKKIRPCLLHRLTYVRVFDGKLIIRMAEYLEDRYKDGTDTGFYYNVVDLVPTIADESEGNFMLTVEKIKAIKLHTNKFVYTPTELLSEKVKKIKDAIGPDASLMISVP